MQETVVAAVEPKKEVIEYLTASEAVNHILTEKRVYISQGHWRLGDKEHIDLHRAMINFNIGNDDKIVTNGFISINQSTEIDLSPKYIAIERCQPQCFACTG